MPIDVWSKPCYLFHTAFEVLLKKSPPPLRYPYKRVLLQWTNEYCLSAQQKHIIAQLLRPPVWWNMCLHELESSLCVRWWNAIRVCNFTTYKTTLMVLSSQPEYTIPLIVISVLLSFNDQVFVSWATEIPIPLTPAKSPTAQMLSLLLKAVVRLLWCVILLYDTDICFMTIPLWHTVVTVMGFHRWCILMTWVQTIMKLTKQWTNDAEMKVQVTYIMLEEDTSS